MGKMSRPWQDTEYVLGLFGKSLKEARRHLERYATQWALKGRCPELIGVEETLKQAGEAYDRKMRLHSGRVWIYQF